MKQSNDLGSKPLDSNNVGSQEIFKLLLEKDNLELQLEFLMKQSNDLGSKPLDSNNVGSQEIFKLLQEKDSLELQLEFLMKQNPISTKLIGEIVSKQINHGGIFILIGFIIGLFLSIFTVLINNSFKTFMKEGL